MLPLLSTLQPENTLERLPTLIRAGVRCFYVETEEEGRALRLLERHADTADLELRMWSAASGVDEGRAPTPLLENLRNLRHRPNEEMWVFLEPDPWLKDPVARRELREQSARAVGPVIVIVSPTPAERALQSSLTPLALPLPTDAELATVAAATLQQWAPPTPQTWVDDEHIKTLAHACVGLGEQQAARALRFALGESSESVDDLLRHVREHKGSMLDTGGALARVLPVSPDEIGGLDALKEWLSQRALSLHPEARLAGIPHPKGVLLVGVQGCGKSLAARACGDLLGLPILRLDVGALFSSALGSSERNLHSVIKVCERMAPIVLWLDEIDKSMPAGNIGASDGGTSARLMASLLTWMQDRTQTVFVVATANDIGRIPPELIRRGRLDETFFIGLPDASARVDILDVHLRKVPARRLGAHPPLHDTFEAFAAVVEAADGWSGAEIEAAVTEARLGAFAQGRPVTADDLRAAVAATVPMSRSHAEPIDALLAWAEHRARLA